MEDLKRVGIEVIFMLLLFQYMLFGFAADFFDSVLVSIAIDVALLLITVLIVDKVVKGYYDGIEKRIVKDQYKDALSTQHKSLVNRLRSLMIHYITKMPSELTVDKKEFEEIINNLNNYIKNDIINKNFELLIVDTFKVGRVSIRKIRYNPFCKFYFKKPMTDEISTFTSKYATLIPKEILLSLFKIEDILRSNVFAVPEDHGVDTSTVPIENFEATDEFIEELKKQLKLIGEEINKIDNYMTKENI